MQQYGFVSGRDCSTNLASLLQEAYRAVDQREQLDVVYTDFSKAFNFLLYKMKSYNIHPNILMLLHSYLTDRRQSYCGWFYLYMENSALRYSTRFSTGASPIFTLFVHDLPKCLSNKCLLFLDDLKVFRQIGCSADTFSLQADLDIIN